MAHAARVHDLAAHYSTMPLSASETVLLQLAVGVALIMQRHVRGRVGV